ncbi:MAG: acyclic terpene utilization AtuA family protein, partial [Gemmatimonadales bacterium]
LDGLIERGHRLDNMDTGAPLDTIRERVQAANVYLGMSPIVEALDRDARIVITGRVTDTALVLGPMFHEFAWDPSDYDLVASGTVAGHIIECGAQSSGGNFQRDWKRARQLEKVGFPIIEAAADGTFVVTKHPGTGGLVSPASVAEQLVYEIGDPEHYLTADGSADFTSIQLQKAGRDRVRVSGIRGGPPTDSYKVSIAYSYGWKAIGTLVYSWPDAYAKAREADRIIRRRLDAVGLEFEKIHTEYVGVDATHGHLAGPPDPDLPEVQLRIGVRGPERGPVDRFTREIAPLVLTGPPGVTGYGYKPDVKEIVAFWPALLDRTEVDPHVAVDILTS